MLKIKNKRTLNKFKKFSIVENLYVDERAKKDYTFQFLEKNDSVLTVIVNNEKLALLEVNRFLIGNSLELVGGRIEDEDTDELHAIKREVFEEIGLKNIDFEFVSAIYPLPNVTNEKVYLFKCNIENAENIKLNRNEGIINLKFYSLAQILILLKNNQIKSAIDAYAIMFYLLKEKLIINNFHNEQE